MTTADLHDWKILPPDFDHSEPADVLPDMGEYDGYCRICRALDMVPAPFLEWLEGERF